jgi:hypothetical protein
MAEEVVMDDLVREAVLRWRSRSACSDVRCGSASKAERSLAKGYRTNPE